MVKRTFALILCVAIAASGCATASMGRGAMQTRSVIDPALLTEYVERIPPGSRVRVERTDGAVIRGTLLKSGGAAVTMQRHTRIPEPPFDVPLASIARLTLDDQRATSTAKAIGIGVASGVGAFFAILAILAASFDD